MPGMVMTKSLDSAASAQMTLKRYLRSVTEPRLHLGCGNNHFKDWLNIDIGGSADICWDFRESFPFIPAQTLALIYSEHVLEHFARKDALRILGEAFRILKKGGIFRIAVPDLDRILREYQDYNPQLRTDVHEEFDQQYGGTFSTRGEFLDICFRGWGHTYLYNEEDLTILLKRCGFRSVVRVPYKVSETPALKDLETRPPNQSALILEATV